MGKKIAEVVGNSGNLRWLLAGFSRERFIDSPFIYKSVLASGEC